ncbi:hypothetical protein A3711_15890 [Erythrobacter sp. HI00D59]|jgi:uncharacterized protein (DUF427 family)|nr:hypothetical protein A3711_15890 [Erythrobacter sp. HI00D59]
MKGGRKPTSDHPITVERAGSQVLVRLDGMILADSKDVLILREASLNPVHYIPRKDVRMELLSRSSTSTHCPYKGDASYFDGPDGTKDIAWSYEDPFDHMDDISDHLAFYPDRVDAIEVL